ncbi:MAG: chlorite dismutase family protein [Chloroflexota bacterium]|nr:chlorite dismutase family protein [Chloroflexota bacterium]
MTADTPRFVQALALGVDTAWRRLPDEERRETVCRFAEAYALEDGDGIVSHAYSAVGLEPDVDLFFVRLAPSVEALSDGAARLLRAGVGRWASVRHAFLGRLGRSEYLRAPSRNQALLDGTRSRYLVVYPFTKTADWYLLGREARQRIMNEHIRVGNGYPQIRQLLAYSFGLDDQDFIVTYETDDLDAFGELVRELRATESRRSTLRDSPLLLGLRRPLEEILGPLAGA